MIQIKDRYERLLPKFEIHTIFSERKALTKSAGILKCVKNRANLSCSNFLSLKKEENLKALFNSCEETPACFLLVFHL